MRPLLLAACTAVAAVSFASAAATAAPAFDAALGRPVTPAMLRNTAAALAREPQPRPPGRSALYRPDAVLYPPFTPSPQLTLTDINGTLVTLPQLGAPTILFIYNASDSTTQAAWGNNAASIDLFLSESVLHGVPAVNATRYAFLSFSASAAPTEAALMRSKLTTRMAALNWPAANQSDWLSRAVFASDPVVVGGAATGWVADLLSNWTSVGATLTVTVPGQHAAVVVPRLDAHFGWLPPTPEAPVPIVYGGNAAALTAGAVSSLPRCNGAGCTVLVGCNFELGSHNVTGPTPTPCNWPAVVQAAEAAGATSVVVVQTPGAPVEDMYCATPAECELELGIPATLLRFEDGIAVYAALLARDTSDSDDTPAVASFTAASASGITFSISADGRLYEVGWLSTTLRFLSWAGQWLDFERRTTANITAAAAAGAARWVACTAALDEPPRPPR